MAVRKMSGISAVFGEEIKPEKQIEKPVKEERVTFQGNNQTLEKIRAIAYWDRVLLKEIINTSMSDYIEKYEKKNGKIKPIPSKE